MTPGREDYLVNIYRQIEERGYATNSDISKFLNVKRPSVTEMVKKLDAEGFVFRQKKKILLTDKGINTAKSMLSKHRLWEYFLKEVLKYKDEDLHEQADKLEHVTDDKLFNALNKLMDYPKTCPHDEIIYKNEE
ncbi:MAG: metal-dependent transcriptional regulator [Tissierellia bacterium]|nr:metal-dependent transcriptional regulator [Tissierellia bacterium]